MTCRYWFLRKD